MDKINRYQIMSLYSKISYSPVLRFAIVMSIFLSILTAEKNYASYSGAFLRMGISARSMAMGSGFTAESGARFAAYYNPAGIAVSKSRQLSFSYHQLPLDRRFISSSFSTHLPPTGGIGIAWISAGVDGIDGRTSSGEPTETLSTSEDAIMLSFAQSIQSWLSIGINVKILRHQLPLNTSGLKGTGIGLDLGIVLFPRKSIPLAFMIQDINSSYQWNTGEVFERGRVYKENFPTIYRIGSSYNLESRNLYFTGDFGYITNHKNTLGYSVRLGTEYRFMDHYFLRGGINENRISLGAGMVYSLLNELDSSIDYALVVESLIGLVHVFTYSVTL